MISRQMRRSVVLATALLTSLFTEAQAREDFVRTFAERLGRLSCAPRNATAEPLLRVMTLNVAHGRRDGPNQIFLDRKAFVDNLAEVSRLIADSRADIVALQEVDGPSRWSGRFDHATMLAERADYPWHFRADHARTWLYRYGTAVLSRLPLSANRSHRFAPTMLTPRKGLVISAIDLPQGPDRQSPVGVDVLSVHFDYLSKRAKRRQVDELVSILDERGNPTILLGDFNSGWHGPDSQLRDLVAATGLIAYQPESDALATHEGSRIDWILISREFRFERYEVLPQIVSDHLSVIADIGFSDASPLRPECQIDQ